MKFQTEERDLWLQHSCFGSLTSSTASCLMDTNAERLSSVIRLTGNGSDDKAEHNLDGTVRDAGTRPHMHRMKSAMRPREVPVAELSVYFVAYKVLLLALALMSSWLGTYDSSSSLIPGGTALNHWDSVYFSHMAMNGYLFEQEFAFGPLLPLLCRFIHPVLLGNMSHYVAVIMFYRATLNAFGSKRQAKISALLHIISPAGIFMCVGYTEPLYAALTFSGLSILQTRPFVSAGLFGLSGLTRATGIINAILFLPRKPEPSKMLKSALYAAIVCLPWLSTQIYAYYMFCPDRPWCSRSPPLIYSFVQDHYWNVGFGRYFTLSNLPLFLISSPMYLLCFLSLDFSLPSVQQGLLTIITLTSAHAQIITRMSSGFPRIHWYLAKMLLNDKKHERWNLVVVFFILYGMVQAVLFGAFLPPA